jgi:hypothetical protein
MKQTFLIIAITLALIANSCKDNGTGPENLEPGRRDYVWNEDTLKIPFNLLSKMWGSSPNDIWAVGSGGGLDQTIWHYDGTHWSTDGISRSIPPTSIWGFSENDVWLGGQSGLIWHYNGSNWEEKLRLTPPELWGRSIFYSVFGNSTDDLYAVGFIDSANVPQKEVGIIFHYNGYNWNRVDIETQRLHFGMIRKAPNEQNYYLVGFIINDDWSNSVKLFSFDGAKLKEIYFGKLNDYKGADLGLINDKIYFGIDSGVYTYDGNKFNLKFKVDNQQFTQGIAGRNDKDVFLYMWDGIAHYNGTDIQYLIQDSDLSYRDIIVFKNDLFVLCNNISKGVTIIKHGKLK